MSLPASPANRLPPRSRAGCLGCKRVHLRCGQQKPRCARCERLQQSCTYPDVNISTRRSRTRFHTSGTAKDLTEGVARAGADFLSSINLQLHREHQGAVLPTAQIARIPLDSFVRISESEDHSYPVSLGISQNISRSLHVQASALTDPSHHYLLDHYERNLAIIIPALEEGPLNIWKHSFLNLALDDPLQPVSSEITFDQWHYGLDGQGSSSISMRETLSLAREALRSAIMAAASVHLRGCGVTGVDDLEYYHQRSWSICQLFIMQNPTFDSTSVEGRETFQALAASACVLCLIESLDHTRVGWQPCVRLSRRFIEQASSPPGRLHSHDNLTKRLQILADLYETLGSLTEGGKVFPASGTLPSFGSLSAMDTSAHSVFNAAEALLTHFTSEGLHVADEENDMVEAQFGISLPILRCFSISLSLANLHRILPTTSQDEHNETERLGHLLLAALNPSNFGLWRHSWTSAKEGRVAAGNIMFAHASRLVLMCEVAGVSTASPQVQNVIAGIIEMVSDLNLCPGTGRGVGTVWPIIICSLYLQGDEVQEKRARLSGYLSALEKVIGTEGPKKARSFIHRLWQSRDEGSSQPNDDWRVLLRRGPKGLLIAC